jgi:uncharacterized Ntn-hydrolase superfamily protein
MTFSIVACSADASSWGVAVASKFLAVGSAVPAALAGAGALATQSYANLAYRPEGLRLLAEGRSAEETLRTLTQADPEREQRQAGVVDARGRAATFTGTAAIRGRVARPARATRSRATSSPARRSSTRSARPGTSRPATCRSHGGW